MKTINLIIVFILILLLNNSFSQTEVELNLMPFPQKVILSEGKFRLDIDFTISIEGNPDPRIYRYATRVLRRLSGRTGLFFTQDVITNETINKNSKCIISVKREGKVKLNENESYSLKITSDKIELYTENDLGALRGLETLLQLLAADETGYFFPVLQIEDEPRFPWRGLMIDAGRHFMPVDVIKRNLDAMAFVKMNVFHWHLSEDQGFRVESKLFPKLHQLGSDGLFYTQDQIKDIITYADERGIRVIPEFDIPGHSTSWFVAYPEFSSAPGPYKIERNWGIFDPVFDPTNEKVYEFFDKFFGEMCKLFPD
ncbi:MAG: family 20 glycosylhydrolase [Ignavibacteriaceae bacterium]|nr:family 20 glycosylhydrolase [Ignavibacteriaceae bacterium]